MEVFDKIVLALLVLAIPCEGISFVATPPEIEMCGSQKTQSLKLSCRPTVPGITQVFAIEIGKMSGLKKSAIARVTYDKASDVVDVMSSLSSRLQHSGSIPGQTGSLDLTLTNLEDSDASKYYCYISYLTDVVGAEHFNPDSSSSYGTAPSCNGVKVIESTKHNVPVNFSLAGMCPNGIPGRSEALLMAFCGAGAISAWGSGKKVMDMCCQVPLYTPVATFEFGFYVQDERGMSGVFLGCTPSGFKMVTQLCGHNPINVTLTSGGSSGYVTDADNYYVVDFKGAAQIPIG